MVCACDQMAMMKLGLVIYILSYILSEKRKALSDQLMGQIAPIQFNC